MPAPMREDPIWQDPHVRAFLADIIEHPDDDAARLILADWLEERDQPLGTFIRAQVLAESETDTTAAERHKRKADALYRKHGGSWFAPFRALEVRCTPRRGFLDKIHCALSTLLAPALADALATQPIQCLRLVDPYARATNDDFAALLAHPLLGRVAEVDLSNVRLGRARVEALVARPPFPRLRALRLRECMLDNDGGLLLAGWPGLGTLRHLVLAGNRMRTAAYRALIASPHLAGLESLDLRRNMLHDALIRALRAHFGARLLL